MDPNKYPYPYTNPQQQMMQQPSAPAGAGIPPPQMYGHGPVAGYTYAPQNPQMMPAAPPAYYAAPPPPAAAQYYGFSGPPMPPPAYANGPQYPTANYCPAPAYQPVIPAQQAQQYSYAAMPAAHFDEGARFKGKGGGQMTIPPPPPGYAPTPAQIAAMQGQPVMMDKKKNNFLMGAKGGFTFW